MQCAFVRRVDRHPFFIRRSGEGNRGVTDVGHTISKRCEIILIRAAPRAVRDQFHLRHDRQGADDRLHNNDAETGRIVGGISRALRAVAEDQRGCTVAKRAAPVPPIRRIKRLILHPFPDVARRVEKVQGVVVVVGLVSARSERTVVVPHRSGCPHDAIAGVLERVPAATIIRIGPDNCIAAETVDVVDARQFIPRRSLVPLVVRLSLVASVPAVHGETKPAFGEQSLAFGGVEVADRPCLGGGRDRMPTCKVRTGSLSVDPFRERQARRDRQPVAELDRSVPTDPRGGMILEPRRDLVRTAGAIV